MEEKTPAKSPVLAEYKRLRRGSYFADFRRDPRQHPNVYHCVVQREDSPVILAWTQHRTLEAAIHAAERELKRLTEQEKTKSTDLRRAS